MGFNHLNWMLVAIAVIAISLQQHCAKAQNEVKKKYWPPEYNAETMDIEKILNQQLDLGCSNNSSAVNTSIIQNFFMVSETENENSFTRPIPIKFIHIPSGTPLELIFECEDCNNNNIYFDGKIFDVTKFDCKTLCIFTAHKSFAQCRRGQSFKVGLTVQENFFRLMEGCHQTGVSTNLTSMAETLIWKLGKFSRAIADGDAMCQQKCMPVCTEREIQYGSDMVMSVEKFASSFLRTVCSRDMMKNPEKVEQIECSAGGRNMVGNWGNIFIVFLILLQFFY